MQTSPQFASTAFPAGEQPAEERRSEERAYRLMTVAAILLVLVSLWVF
ncbi:MAG: hypothetical protein WCE75_03750 [Terracidiphilus sp.]